VVSARHAPYVLLLIKIGSDPTGHPFNLVTAMMSSARNGTCYSIVDLSAFSYRRVNLDSHVSDTAAVELTAEIVRPETRTTWPGGFDPIRLRGNPCTATDAETGALLTPTLTLMVERRGGNTAYTYFLHLEI
jgi:hypothetical protein